VQADVEREAKRPCKKKKKKKKKKKEEGRGPKSARPPGRGGKEKQFARHVMKTTLLGLTDDRLTPVFSLV